MSQTSVHQLVHQKSLEHMNVGFIEVITVRTHETFHVIVRETLFLTGLFTLKIIIIESG